jgi:hypothetical protein
VLNEGGAILGVAISEFNCMYSPRKINVSAITSKFRTTAVFVIINLQKIFSIWYVGMTVVSPYRPPASNTSLGAFMTLRAKGYLRVIRCYKITLTKVACVSKLCYRTPFHDTKIKSRSHLPRSHLL